MKRMNVQHGNRVRVLTCVLAAVAVAVTWAGAVAPARAAGQGMTTGVGPPGAGDASAIGVARPAGHRYPARAADSAKRRKPRGPFTLVMLPLPVPGRSLN